MPRTCGRIWRPDVGRFVFRVLLDRRPSIWCSAFKAVHPPSATAGVKSFRWWLVAIEGQSCATGHPTHEHDGVEISFLLSCLPRFSHDSLLAMATHFRDNHSIHTVADACAAIAGGLDSDPQTKHLAPLWDALTAKGDALASGRRTAERVVARARAKVSVMDAIWDPEIGAFGRAVVDQSGGKRDQAPYTRFFKDVSPSGAQDFGIDREVKQGRDWVAELGRHPTEPLAVTWTPRVSLVTENLAEASASRRDALQALALQGTAEELFIADVNRELDIVEAELQKLFPGQPKRVASYLEATRPANKRARTDDDASTENG